MTHPRIKQAHIKSLSSTQLCNANLALSNGAIYSTKLLNLFPSDLDFVISTMKDKKFKKPTQHPTNEVVLYKNK